MLDATGNPATIGNYYGYTQSNNGITNHVIGKCREIKNGKLTLDNIRETTFVGLSSGKQTGRTSHPERARSVSSVICFPVDINQAKSF